MGDGLMGVVIQDVTQHHSCAFKPGHRADCAQVGGHDVIAVAFFPTGGSIARRCSHLEICGQQVIAAMGFFEGGFNKVYRVKPFADQAALHINKTNENGVNVTGSNHLFEAVEIAWLGHCEAPKKR